MRWRDSLRRGQAEAARIFQSESRDRANVAVNESGDINILENAGLAVPLSGQVPVTDLTAESLPAVWRCINLISGSVAGMPIDVCDLYGEKLDTDPYIALLDAPDPDRTMKELIKQSVMACLLYGNAYWVITSRDSDGFPDTVSLMRYWDIYPYTDSYTGRIEYYNVYNTTLPPRDVIHFRGPTLPGEHVGMNPLWYFNRTLGNAIGQDDSAKEMLVSGGLHHGHWEYMSDGYPSPDQVKKTKEAYKDSVAGRSRTPPVYGGKLKWVTDTFDPATLQLLESRHYSATEICMIYGVQPHMIGLPVKDTMHYSSAVMNSSHFVKWTLSDWMSTITTKLNQYLPTGYRCKFQPAKLLQPDDKERAEIYKIYIDMGVLDRAEVRAAEGWLGPPPEQAPQRVDQRVQMVPNG